MISKKLSFSWKQFWITFVYENLPPVLVSPIAALLIERSWLRAWYVCENRNLWSLSTRYRPIGFMVFSWLVVYPSSWIITVGFFLSIFGTANSNQIDPYQIVLAYMFLFMRRLIISVKYAYFTAEEFEALARPAPEWTNDKSTRKLVGIGWSAPTNFPGLLEQEVAFSVENARSDMTSQKISLHSVSKSTDVKQGKHNIEVTPRALLGAIINKVYSKKKPRIYDAYVVMMALSIAIFPPIIHGVIYPNSFSLGGDLFIENIARFLACMSGIGIMGFGLVCAFDFKRRHEALKLLRNLVEPTGLRLSSFTNFGLNVDGYKEYDFKLPLSKSENVIAFMEIRNCIIRFGEQFYLRIQGYTSILILCAVFAVVMLNSIIWTQASHHATTIVMITLIIFAIGSISLFAMFSAISLQKARLADIDFLRSECLIIESSTPTNDQDEYYTSQQNKSISILEKAIGAASFNDLTHAPTGILGQAADNKLITSILGILITGCLLAIQGFVDVGIAYDALGWSG